MPMVLYIMLMSISAETSISLIEGLSERSRGIQRPDRSYNILGDFAINIPKYQPFGDSDFVNYPHSGKPGMLKKKRIYPVQNNLKASRYLPDGNGRPSKWPYHERVPQSPFVFRLALA